MEEPTEDRPRHLGANHPGDVATCADPASTRPSPLPGLRPGTAMPQPRQPPPEPFGQQALSRQLSLQRFSGHWARSKEQAATLVANAGRTLATAMKQRTQQLQTALAGAVEDSRCAPIDDAPGLRRTRSEVGFRRDAQQAAFCDPVGGRLRRRRSWGTGESPVVAEAQGSVAWDDAEVTEFVAPRCPGARRNEASGSPAKPPRPQRSPGGPEVCPTPPAPVDAQQRGRSPRRPQYFSLDEAAAAGVSSASESDEEAEEPTLGTRGPVLDWPLSRAEKRFRVIQLLDRERMVVEKSNRRLRRRRSLGAPVGGA